MIISLVENLYLIIYYSCNTKIRYYMLLVSIQIVCTIDGIKYISTRLIIHEKINKWMITLSEI